MNRAKWSKLAKWLGAAVIVGAAVYRLQFAPIEALSVDVRRADLSREVLGTGTLEARVSMTVSPKIAGRITRVLVDQGERVEKDQLLVQMDDDELQQQVEIARANQEAAQAAVQRLTADKSRAAAVYKQAESHHDRVQTLHQRNAATREEVDRAVELLAVATAESSRAEAAISEGQKGLIAAEKTLEYHRARLADTRIMSPFSGLIVDRKREAGDIAIPGSSVLTLISTDVMWVRAWVDETQMSLLAVDQPARIVFRSEPAASYSGKVVRLGKEADRETREFIVDVQADELPTNWAIGQRVEVYIETEKRQEVLTIPLTAIVRRGERIGVFTLDDGAARWREVRLGLRGADAAEVLEGLDETTVVLVSSAGKTDLLEGRRIAAP